MGITKYRRRFTDTGTANPMGDTGPSVWGALWQIQWVAVTADTGASLRIDMLTQHRAVAPNTPNTNDTGMGVNLFTKEDMTVAAGGTSFTIAPRQRLHDPAGTEDTGLTPYVFAGERPRVKITPTAGTVGMDGWLTMWWVD